jgi:hypothetical protein
VRALDGHLQAAAQLFGATGVIDVAVRQQDLLDPEAHLGDCGVDAVEVPAWIDDGAELGRAVPDERAVLLERRHRHDGGVEACGRLGDGGCHERAFSICRGRAPA